jgi:hypothetical protein
MLYIFFTFFCGVHYIDNIDSRIKFEYKKVDTSTVGDSALQFGLGQYRSATNCDRERESERVLV